MSAWNNWNPDKLSILQVALICANITNKEGLDNFSTQVKNQIININRALKKEFNNEDETWLITINPKELEGKEIDTSQIDKKTDIKIGVIEFLNKFKDYATKEENKNKHFSPLISKEMNNIQKYNFMKDEEIKDKLIKKGYSIDNKNMYMELIKHYDNGSDSKLNAVFYTYFEKWMTTRKWNSSLNESTKTKIFDNNDNIILHDENWEDENREIKPTTFNYENMKYKESNKNLDFNDRPDPQKPDPQNPILGETISRYITIYGDDIGPKRWENTDKENEFKEKMKDATTKNDVAKTLFNYHFKQLDLFKQKKATYNNDESSRSHLIFEIKISAEVATQKDTGIVKIIICDLAGKEDYINRQKMNNYLKSGEVKGNSEQTKFVESLIGEKPLDDFIDIFGDANRAMNEEYYQYLLSEGRMINATLNNLSKLFGKKIKVYITKKPNT